MQPLNCVIEDETASSPSVVLALPPAGQGPGLLSTDAGGSASSTNMIQRLLEQNRTIREAWEAERKYLEANRERAEEVYKEERELMEEDRMAWATERDSLRLQIRTLQSRVLELQNGLPLGMSGRAAAGNREIAPKSSNVLNSLGGGSRTLRQRLNSTGLQQHLHQRGGDAAQHAAYQPAIAQIPPPHSGAAELPTTAHRSLSMQAESAPFIPAVNQSDQRSKSLPTLSSSPPTMPSVSEEDEQRMDPLSDQPVPSVDVQTIHPELEGIPIRATAIHPTFTDKLTSPTGLWSSNGGSARPSSPPNEPEPRPAEPVKRGSKEQTLKILERGETHRLTLYAGHTPNHSLSVLPSVVGTEAVNTASSSGDSTPSLQTDGNGAESTGGDDVNLLERAKPSEEDEQTMTLPFTTEPVEPPPTTTTKAELLRHINAELERAPPEEEDRELSGPLMVRNMPAHDEIFFRHLSDRLEEVVQDQEAAVPAVLRASSENGDAATNTTDETAGNGAAAGEADGASDSSAAKSNGSHSDEEMEIPLKLKKSNNFGVPFGQFR